MAKVSAQGWLPIAIGFDAQPAVVSEATVRWLDFGSTPLAEPFLNDTIAKLRKANPPAREIDTDIEAMVRVAARLPFVRPAGFIFHISRCGSTLIANGLRTADRVLMVSESRPVTGLLRPYSESIGPYLTARWNQTRRKLLESLFSLYACYRTGEPERLVIKFTSINILCMSVVRSYWPDVPCVVVVRDPVEVMVASLQGGGWMSLKDSPEAARQMFGWTGSTRMSDQMSDEEFAARVLGRYLAAGRESLDGKCMVVDYADLNPDRVRQIAAFFGLELPSNPEPLEDVFSLYAKDPSKLQQFHDDREHKQRLANAVIRSAAHLWAMEPYAALRAASSKRTLGSDRTPVR